MAETVTVKVTPEARNGKNIDAKLVGKHVNPVSGAIKLDKGKDYDIVFTLVPAHGVNAWRSNDPFGNLGTSNSCPLEDQGATAPFRQGTTNGATTTVHLSAQSEDCEIKYRLNYNDELTTDPIMIIT